MLRFDRILSDILNPAIKNGKLNLTLGNDINKGFSTKWCIIWTWLTLGDGPSAPRNKRIKRANHSQCHWVQ